MNRELLLGAGTLFALANGALATEITFDNFCDGMKITTRHSLYQSVQTGDCLQGVLVIGDGFKVGTRASGYHVVLGVNWEAYDGAAAGSEQYAYILQFPFVTGGTWQEIRTTIGHAVRVLNTGTYTVAGAGVKGPVGQMPTALSAAQSASAKRPFIKPG